MKEDRSREQEKLRPVMPIRPDSRHLRRSGQRASKLIPIILGTKLRLRYEKHLSLIILNKASSSSLSL